MTDQKKIFTKYILIKDLYPEITLKTLHKETTHTHTHTQGQKARTLYQRRHTDGKSAQNAQYYQLLQKPDQNCNEIASPTYYKGKKLGQTPLCFGVDAENTAVFRRKLLVRR